jgi:hypothetical protein
LVIQAIGANRTRDDLLPFLLTRVDDVLIATAKILPRIGEVIDSPELVISVIDKFCGYELAEVREAAIDSLLCLSPKCTPLIFGKDSLYARLAQGNNIYKRASAASRWLLSVSRTASAMLIFRLTYRHLMSCLLSEQRVGLSWH